MEVITLSGTLPEPPETKTDKRGNNYVRFRVVCTGTDMRGQERTTIYRCYCYNLKWNTLKKGDSVFLTGSFNHFAAGGSVQFDVYVQQMASVEGVM